MKTLSVSKARAKLSSLVENIEHCGEDVVITRHGRAAAVLVSAKRYDSLKETHSIRADRKFMRDIRRGLAALKARKARLYTLEELLK